MGPKFTRQSLVDRGGGEDSLVDAGIIVAHGTAPLALVAVAGFILTLALQRIVPGN